MFVFLLKLLWLLVWLGVLGFGVFSIVKRQIIRGIWLIVCAIFGLLSLFLGFFAGRDLVGIFFSAIALCLVAVGEQALSNLYYALTAPTYSLRIMAKEDNFSFSLFLVLLGGLFLGLYASFADTSIQNAFTNFARSFVNNALANYPNPVYRDTVFSLGVGRMEVGFDAIYTNNFVWLPVIWVVVWFVSALLHWFLLRLFGSQATYKELLSGLAYFFCLNGVILGYFYFHTALSLFNSLPGSITLGALDYVGVLLFIASLIYFIVCLSHSAEVGLTQAVVVFVVVMAIWLGGSIGGYFYKGAPAFEAFKNELASMDPSKM